MSVPHRNRPLALSLALGLLAAWAVACAASPAAPVARTQGLIAEGTRWQTAYYMAASERDGPTVLVTAGIHGNEPAGAFAASQIRDWPIRRGTLIVVPRANAPGLAKGTRRLPGVERGARDANRNFPTSTRERAVGTLCKALWAFAVEHSPDWHVDLHEGYGVRGAGSKSVGSSIIVWPDDEAKEAQRLMLEAVNATVADPGQKFVALRPPAKGSFVRASARRLGAKALICETTWSVGAAVKGTKRRRPLALRIRQHRIMVHRLLEHLDMAACGPDRLLPPREPGSGSVRVAVYNGPGTTNAEFLRLRAVLGRRGDVVVRAVGPWEVGAGVLDQFDVAVFPAGRGEDQGRALGEAGRRAVRAFAQSGGGVVGIGGGAAVVTCGAPWGLAILDARVAEPELDLAKDGTLTVALTPKGQRLLGTPDEPVRVGADGGPLLTPAGMPELPDFTALAHYRGKLPGRGGAGRAPAILWAPFGRGAVVAFGPRPEAAEAEELLVAAVRLCAGGRRPAPADQPLPRETPAGARP